VTRKKPPQEVRLVTPKVRGVHVVVAGKTKVVATAVAAARRRFRRGDDCRDHDHGDGRGGNGKPAHGDRAIAFRRVVN
jgi:hypothetical protein